SELNQLIFGPGSPIDGHAGGQRAAARVAHWNIDGRKSRGRRKELAVVAMRRVEIADQSRWIAPGWIHKCIELQPVHGLNHCLADLLAICRFRLTRGRLGTVLRSSIGLLQTTLSGRMETSRLDDIRETLHRHAIALRREVTIDVVL